MEANIEAKDTMIRKTPCNRHLPELEVPMINTMVACLGVQHRKLNDLNMQFAYGATRLVGIPSRSRGTKWSCGCGTRSGKICGRTCKSKMDWSFGARRIMRFRAH